MKTNDPSYSRSQLETALWQTFTQGDLGNGVDRTFRGRIQKLLDLDREAGSGSRASGAAAPYAFHREAPPGRGQDVAFTLLDAFCLGIGLDLLDLGFKQSEVVFLLRHLRGELANALKGIRADPPMLRASLEQQDRRVFMVLRKVELHEAFGAGHATPDPLILTPRFLPGPKAGSFLADLGYADRSRVRRH